MVHIDTGNMDPRSASHLHKFHPVHQRLLVNLLSPNVGFFNRKYKIRKVQRCGKALYNAEEKHVDMFVLSVPICDDQILEWQVILNEFKPQMRPDFKVFNAGFAQFLCSNMIRTGLFHYDAEDKDALLRVVDRLRQMYVEYVLISLNKSNYCLDNITSVLEVLRPPTHELIQFHNLVNFSLHLPLDFSRIQLNLNAAECNVTLTLSCPYPHGSDLDYQARVHMGPELSDELGADQIKYPKFGRDKPMTKYIYTVIARLQSHIDNLATLQRLRKQFILSLLTISGLAVVHWDAISFQHASFLYNTGAFYWLVSLDLTTDEVRPRLTSIYTEIEQPLAGVPLESADPLVLLTKIANVGERQRMAFVRGLMSSIRETEREESR